MLSLLITQTALAETDFQTIYPIEQVPNWGAMRSASEWNRRFSQMEPRDFVNIPVYNLRTLTTPLERVRQRRSQRDISILTTKLTYSTRFFGSYDIDAGEMTGKHPGVDMKLAPGTPIHSIANGTVHDVRFDNDFGHHVLIEHQTPDEGTVYAIFAHLEKVLVHTGDDVLKGSIIGLSGNSGNSSAPHLHLQIDRSTEEENHEVYWPEQIPDQNRAQEFVLHPIEFIEKYKKTEG